MPWRLSGLLKINKETSTSVNHLKRLDNNEHRINQRIVLIAVTVLIVLRAGKIALMLGLLKESISVANIVFVASFIICKIMRK